MRARVACATPIQCHSASDGRVFNSHFVTVGNEFRKHLSPKCKPAKTNRGVLVPSSVSSRPCSQC